ncbi:MAG: sigma-70 family RNA polymerase sigma factor [Phycisphaerae bacterium]|nr:sigma-70 family RNA polymerase sigma factor [Phycisphaerae bacterium]
MPNEEPANAGASPDATLSERVRRAVRGDADALSDLLAEHGPQVERGLVIAKQWRRALEPADIMQVTYLEAFLEIARFDPSRAAAFPAWLGRLAENNLRDAIRGLSRQKRAPERRLETHAANAEASRDRLLETLAATSSTPSRSLRRAEAHRLLDRAIEDLPLDYQTVIRAYDLEGRSIEDVARDLGRSPGAVHMLRARAFQRLGALLGSM